MIISFCTLLHVPVLNLFMPLNPWQGGPPQMNSTSPGFGILATMSGWSLAVCAMHSLWMLSETNSSIWLSIIALYRMTLQFAAITAPPKFASKALAAMSSYSMAHFVSQTPAWWKPSVSPPQPAKMSRVLSGRNFSARGRSPEGPWPVSVDLLSPPLPFRLFAGPRASGAWGLAGITSDSSICFSFGGGASVQSSRPISFASALPSPRHANRLTSVQVWVQTKTLTPLVLPDRCAWPSPTR